MKTITNAESHVLEQIFDVPDGTTLVEYEERLPTPVKPHTSYDTKDTEIENQFQEIYDTAMDAYEVQMGETEGLDNKFRARNGEIASIFLNTALSAAKEKAELKKHKDKLPTTSAMEDGKININNNNLILNHADLLRILKENS